MIFLHLLAWLAALVAGLAAVSAALQQAWPVFATLAALTLVCLPVFWRALAGLRDRQIPCSGESAPARPCSPRPSSL